MRFGTCFAGALVIGLASQSFLISPASAQSLPSGCVPTGTTYECLDVMEEPWEYTHNTCNTHEYRASEEESFQDELDDEWSWACNLTTERVGWYTTETTVGLCGFTNSPPNYNFGIETFNVSKYLFTYQASGCGQLHQNVTNNAVMRNRDPMCPLGYSLYGSGNVFRCRRPVGNREPAKSLGCPTESCAGNPINPAIGNKYQEETDYQSAGNGGLQIKRYYNSAMDYVRSSGHVSSFYSVSQEWEGDTGWFGYAEFGKLAMQTESPRYHLMAMDAIGAHWRHYYQRAIVLESSTSMTTAIAYRHDGKVTTFNLYQGNYVPQADISDRLVQLSDGRFQFTASSDESVETYLPDGHLESIRSRSGQAQFVTYDACGRIATVTDDFGKQLQFNYAHDCNSASRAYRITSITTPSGQTISYGYNATTGALTSVTYPDGTVRGYTSGGYNGRLLTGIVDESGSTYASWAYDSNGRAISSQHAGGADAITISYPAGSFWNITDATVTDSFGSITKHYYSPVRGTNRVTRIEQPHPSGTGTASRWFTHDANGNVATFQNRRTYKTSYTYDLTRNLETSRTEGLNSNGTPNPESRTITTQWHATFRLPTLITETGRTTGFTFDSNGNRLTKTVTDTATSASRTWTWTYDGYGRVLTEDGPRTDVADVTTYTYYTCTTGYECGQLHTATNAAGHVTTYSTYNAHGQPLSILDPNSVVTTLTYDARQRLTNRNVGGEATAFQYWPTGLLKRVTSADGSHVEYTYDAAHRLTQIADDENNRIVYTLDAMGNRIQEQNLDSSGAVARKHHRTINFLNLIKEEIGSANSANVTTALTYDNNANLKTTTAPLGRVTTNSYDKLDRLIQVTNPASGITGFAYNARDDLLSVTDPRGLVTNYAYNGLGDLTQLTSPDTGVTGHSYDSGGNPLTRTDARGQTATYGHDALNRITSAVHSDQTIGYSYDSGTNGAGRLTGLSDNSGSTAWAYTAQGRVATRTQVTSGLTRNVGYGYDSSGRLSTVTYPSGVVITYGYTNGKVTSVTSGSETILSDVLYDPFGPIRGWTWGNASAMARTYDLDGNLDQLDSGGLKTYAQDDAFRITGIIDMADASKSWSYGYDLLDRLTSATRTGLTQDWSYDANGNRLSQTGSAASSYTMAGTSNRLSGVSGALSRSFSYDAAGNATADGSATFGYDGAGRLTSASKGGTSASYAQNTLGQRVRKTVNGVVTIFCYDESGHLLGEYEASGALIREYVWLGDIPVAVITAGPGTPPFHYWSIHTDHLNTPRSVAHPVSGQRVWRWDSAPFGESAPDEDPDGDLSLFTMPLRFPGQYADAETGLNYNYFRDYEPQIGRYVQSDPLGLFGGVNTYSYALASPVLNFDPTGEIVPGIVGGILALCRLYPMLCIATAAAIVDTITGAASDSADTDSPSNCPPEKPNCQEHFVGCLQTALADEPGSVFGSSRCGLCRDACVRYGYWPDVALTGGKSVRCDYWNY